MLRKLLPLYFIIFLGFFGYSLMITVFTPLFLHGDILHDSMHSRTVWLGFVLMLYPLGQFVGSPIAGALSDKYGRKPTLIMTLIVTTLAYIFISLSLEWNSLSMLIISSIIAGLAEANTVIAQSAIADVTDHSNRGKFFGYIYLSASSAYIVGPLLGGKLADPSLISWFNMATPFWFSTILVFVTVLLAAFMFKETHLHHDRNQIKILKAFSNILNIFTHKRARTLFLVNFCFYLAIFGFFRCYPMYIVDQFNLTVSQESEYIAWVSVPIILSNLFLTGFFLKRMSAKTLAIWSGIFTGIFMILIVIPHIEWALWITLFLAGLAVALELPACATHLSTSVTAEEQGQVMGNNNSLAVLAEALSGIVGGLLAAIAFTVPLFVLGVVAWVGVVILLRTPNVTTYNTNTKNKKN